MNEEKNKTYTKIQSNKKLRTWFKSNLINIENKKKNKKKKPSNLDDNYLADLTESYFKNIDGYLKNRTEKIRKKFDFPIFLI